MKFTARIPASFLLFAFLSAIYFFTMSSWIQYGDEQEKYLVAQSIAERGDFSIRSTAMNNKIGIDQRTYSTYELGQSLFELPFYILGKVVYSVFPTPDPNQITQLFVGLLNPLLIAGVGLVLFQIALELGFQSRTSLILALVLGLATILWPYSSGYTREPLLTFLILLSVFFLFRFGQTSRPRWLFAAATCIGVLIFTKFLQVILLPAIVLYILLCIRNSLTLSSPPANTWTWGKVLGLFFLPAIFFLVLQSLYSWSRFGSPFNVAGTRIDTYSYYLALVLQALPLEMASRLFFSLDKSVFLYSPPIFLMPVAWAYWVASKRREAFLVLGIVLSTIAIALVRPDGDGGTWWGSRYLVQIIPLTIIPLIVVSVPAAVDPA